MDAIQQWIDSVKHKGMSDEQIQKMMQGLENASALELQAAILTMLTDVDLQEIEQIEDDAVGQAKVVELFTKRTGVSPEEFIRKLREQFAQKARASLDNSKPA